MTAKMMAQARQVKKIHVFDLLRKRNVVGVGLGYKISQGVNTGELSLVVSVTHKEASAALVAKDLVPRSLDGVKTDVVETGILRAFQPEPSPVGANAPMGPLDRWRPVVPPGVSLGHYQITAGTFGCLVRRGEERFILSNNHVLAACFDEETEVLTDDGFKRFPDVKKTDRIATLNPESHEIEYHRPIEYHEYEYQGPMIHFRGRFIDLMVTPNHRLYCKKTWFGSSEREKEGDWQFMTAEEALERYRGGRTTSIRFKRDGKWSGNVTVEDETLTYAIPKVQVGGAGFNIPEYDLETFLQFLGWYLSEGSSCPHTDPRRGTEYVVSIRNTSPENLDEIECTFEDMGLNPHRSKGEVRVYSKQLYSYVRNFGKAGDKYVPQDVKMLPPRYLGVFFDAFTKGDGCYPSRARQRGTLYRSFVSKSERLVDDLQEIALKLGLTGKKLPRYGSPYNPDGKYYTLSTYDTYLDPMVRQEPKIIDYSGKVYCLTVPNHVMLVRRNGQTVWSGNSNRGQPGDAILQPGPADGGASTDRVAALADYIPLDFGTAPSECPVADLSVKLLNYVAGALGSSHQIRAVRQTEGVNRVDAALARPLSPDLVSNDILYIGAPVGVGAATLGTEVQKTGRTTGHTQGTIIQIDATMSISYGEHTALFTGQLVAGPSTSSGHRAMSKPGDSGSAVLDMDKRVVGLLFAGSEAVTIINPIDEVFAALNVELAL